MIERLHIRGFKAIGPAGVDLPMAPITVLLGENSVGKSSMFQMVLALQQSWMRFAGIGFFSPVGPNVDLGRFSNIQHRMGCYVFHETAISLEARGEEIEFWWDAPTQSEVTLSEEQISEPPEGWPSGWRRHEDVDRGLLG